MFRFSDQTPISFSDPLPDRVDVAVIGGGVIGICTAWFLRQRGLSVLVCDKGRIAGEQSSRNWGWVRVTFRDPDEVPIAIESLRQWESLASEVPEDLGFTRQGILALAADDQELAEFEQWCEFAEQFELDSRMFSAAEIGDWIQVPTTGWKGGVITPSDARAEPFKAVPAIARELRARGGVIREQCAVRTLDVAGGRVAGVATEAGLVQAQTVVCAAGAWSTLFLSNAGVRLPQLAVKATVARTEQAPDVFGGAAALHDVFVRRRQDGGYTATSGFTEHLFGPGTLRNFIKFLPSRKSASDIRVRLGRDVTQLSIPRKSWSGEERTPFEEHRVLNPDPSDHALKMIRERLRARVPSIADIPFAESWAGMIDATPDIVPVMDEVPAIPGLFVATGFSGHGFGIGPGAGRVMADLISGGDPGHDLSRFRFSRFSDGSKLRPGPAI